MNNEYLKKYLKYKEKYLNLKQNFTKKQKAGSDVENLKNILVMGTGPVGLTATLALLTKYNRRNCKSEDSKVNLLEANNIFLLGKDVPWRQQIFFFQDSFRDYDSIDFFRDIDLETYKILEKIGCYIGSPPSTQMPFCFAYPHGTAVSRNNTDIRAPKNIDMDKTDTSKPLYLMTHLSFHVSDLESVLLDKIIQYNDINIKYYLSIKNDDFDAKYKKYENVLNNDNNKLVKSLLIKDFLKSNKLINIEDFKPIVVIVHPYNKFCNIKQIILYNLILGDKTINESEFLKSNEYIDDCDLKKVGNNPSSKWNLQNDEGSISFFYYGHNKADKFISPSNYDVVFEASGGNKQFGNRDDYHCLSNKEELDITNRIELKKNKFLSELLDNNSVITLTNSTLSDHYIIINKQKSSKLEKKNIVTEYTFNIKKIIMQEGNNDLLKSSLGPSDYKMILKIDLDMCKFKEFIKKNIDYVKKIKYDESNKDIESLGNDVKIDKIINYLNNMIRGGNSKFNNQFINSSRINYIIDKQNNVIEQIAYQLYFKFVMEMSLDSIEINNLGTKEIIKYQNIYKINTLKFEEKKMNLDENTKHAIVFASVLMFPTQTDKLEKGPNYLYVNKFKDMEDTKNIPLTSTLSDYRETKEFRKRVDFRTMPNQVYINNDQVQYFNNQFYNYTRDDKEILSGDIGPYPQHVFRVFGVNTLNDTEGEANPIVNNEIKNYYKYTTTKKNYYCGIQISSEFNSFVRGLKYDENNKELVELIYKILFSIAFVFTQPDKWDNNSEKFYENVMKTWNETYGKKKPIGIDFNTPIHNESKSIFPITLKYKESTIEIDDKEKIIFNLGDSNTTVNFFSGTGLNTGVSNVKFLLDNYKIDNSTNDAINKNLMKKNRRTIYNSLLSTQNPTYLPRFRLYGENGGPYKNYEISKISKHDFDNLKKNAREELELNDNKKQNYTILNLTKYFENFETIFNNFKTNDNIKVDTDDAYKQLYYIFYSFIYNLYTKNPILSVLSKPSKDDYERESITYLNHLIFNYFDFCNSMFTRDANDNQPYYCDILELEKDFDPKRTFQYVKTGRFDT